MGMATILFNGTEPFKQTINNLLTEGPMWIYWNCSVVLEKETLKNYGTQFYACI